MDLSFSRGPAQAFTLIFAHIHLSMTIWKCFLIWLDVIRTAVGNSDWSRRDFVCCSLLACNYISSDNNQIRKAALKESRVRFSQKINFSHGWQANTTKKGRGKIFEAQGCETAHFQWNYHGQTRLNSQTKWDSEVVTWHRINGRCWRPLDPYDKVMKERRMTGVQPGRAWGPPCLTNTLCARWTDGSRIQKKDCYWRRPIQYKPHKRQSDQ